MEVWKIIFLSKWVICTFHVIFQGVQLEAQLASLHLKPIEMMRNGCKQDQNEGCLWVEWGGIG